MCIRDRAESAVIAVQQQDHRVVLTILRYLAAIGSMLVGLSALLALVVVGWRLWVDFDQIAARGYCCLLYTSRCV